MWGCENGASNPSHVEKHLGMGQSLSPGSCTSAQTPSRTKVFNCASAARISGAIAWIAHSSIGQEVTAIA